MCPTRISVWAEPGRSMTTSRLAGGLDGRQQQRDEYRDNRNDDQQLDEREGANFVFAKYAFHDCSFGYWVTVRAL